MMNTLRPRLVFLLGLLGLVVSPAAAPPVAADTQSVWTTASAKFKNDETRLPGRAMYAPAQGTYTLGENTARMGTFSHEAQRETFRYEPFDLQSVHASIGFSTLGADALSIMLTENLEANGKVPYSINVLASVRSRWYSEGGYAAAQGHDPQYILVPGIIGGTLTLEAGSTVFASRPDMDGARVSYEITAPLLHEPLARVEIVTTSFGLDATVLFASSPHLTFLDPATEEPIEAWEIEQMLESDGELGTADGLTRSLPLFIYLYDATNLSLPVDAAVGSAAEAESFVVEPEVSKKKTD